MYPHGDNLLRRKRQVIEESEETRAKHLSRLERVGSNTLLIMMQFECAIIVTQTKYRGTLRRSDNVAGGYGRLLR